MISVPLSPPPFEIALPTLPLPGTKSTVLLMISDRVMVVIPLSAPMAPPLSANPLDITESATVRSTNW